MTATLDTPVTDEDFDEPDLPPDPDETAGHEIVPPGYTIDRETGEPRPKRRPGRPKKPPSAEELRDRPAPPPQEEDQAPGPRTRAPKAKAADVPMPKGGVIAAAVNKLYRRAGKIVRAMDDDIGTAIIECSQHGDPDSVGVAWENLAKTDPAVRAWLLRIVKGGAWTDLLLAHAPIGMAIVMKPRIQAMLTGRRMGQVVEAFLEADEDDPEGMAGGLDLDTAEKLAARHGLDMDQMMAKAEEVAERMAERRAPVGVAPRRAPNGFREQPKRTSRAQRSGK